MGSKCIYLYGLGMAWRSQPHLSSQRQWNSFSCSSNTKPVPDSVLDSRFRFSPCSPMIRSCSAVWLSFFILPFFFTSARLGLERSMALFLTPRFEVMLESWVGEWGLCLLLRSLGVVES